jgi:hypothetical protein
VNKIKITTHKICSEKSTKIRKQADIILESLQEKYELAIGDLESIIVTGDFQFTMSSLDKLVYAEESYVFGLNQFVYRYNSEGYTTNIILTDKTWENQDDPTLQHMLHHELLHACDISHQYKCFKTDFMNKIFDGVKGKFYPLALSAWLEYYANFHSGATLSQTYSLVIPNVFFHYMNATPNLIHNEIKEYRLNPTNDQRVQLMENSLKHGKPLLLSGAYFLGYISGAGLNIENFTDKLRGEAEDLDLFLSRLNDPSLAHFWNDMQCVLDEMHNSYVNWKSLDIYDPLIEVVQRFFENMGVQLCDKNGSIWLDFLVSPETTPSLIDILQRVIK